MRVLLILLSLILIMPSVFAFDGKRKGFVIGGGLGFSPKASFNNGGKYDEKLDFSSSMKEAVCIAFGYAWDEHNQVLFTMSGVRYQNDELEYDFYGYFWGPVWYHYYGKSGNALFTTFGVGQYLFESDDDHGPCHQEKVALLFGGGYEFKRHFQIQSSLVYGKTDYFGMDFYHTHVAINLTGYFY